MTPLEKRYKSLLGLLTLLTIGAQSLVIHAWLQQEHLALFPGITEINSRFWALVFHDLLYQITVIDFTVTALLVYAWMVWDSKRRGHPWRAWFWFPLFMITPSLGTLGYLLTRRGWEFPLPPGR